ncbi:hypothetical protein AB0H88_22440, partial [Nonomuraea sp. NPDC050680]
YAGTQGGMPVREETYAAPAPTAAPPAPPQWQSGGYQMGPGHPSYSSYPSNPEPAGAGTWPSMPQWPSDPRAGSGGYDTADVWVPSRGQGGGSGGGGGGWSGDNGLPKQPTNDQPPFQPPANWSFGDRPVEQSPPPRPRYDFPETESAATGPIPIVNPPSSGDEYLPIFASIESAWFEHDGEGGASWGSAKADAGWHAAAAVVEPVRDGATAAGLPKRVPKANLVPGSAATSTAPKDVTPTPSISPERARNRLAGFQKGLRAAREDISTGRAPSTGPMNREQGA